MRRRRIFEKIVEPTGRVPGDLVLVDDKEENVRALEAMGGRGGCHIDATTTRQNLVGHGILPPRTNPRRPPGERAGQ